MAVEIYNTFPSFIFDMYVFIFVPMHLADFTASHPPHGFESNAFMTEIVAWLDDPLRAGRWGWAWDRYEDMRVYPNRLCFYFDDPNTAFEFKLRYG